MRHLYLGLIGVLFFSCAVVAQDGQENAAIAFQGKGNCITRAFSVQDGCRVKFVSDAPIKIRLVSPNGSADTLYESNPKSTAPTYSGWLDALKKGSYSLEVSTGGTWQINLTEDGYASDLSIGGTQVETPGTASAHPIMAGTTTAPVAVSVPPPASVAPSAPKPPPPVPAAPSTTPGAPGNLSADQERAVVLVAGDRGEGTGFLVITPDGPAVVTNIHVISNNPNLKITTNTGAAIPMVSAKGASDRDLALLQIKDAGYSYLQFSTDVAKVVQNGDEVITPGNSQGGEVMLNTPGKILGIGPQRIEIDNPIYHGNSGGPIFHTKTHQVVGVVSEAIKVDTSNQLDKSSFASRNSAISGSMRYFGMRLDNVPSWIPIDWNRFQTETLFLDQFHQQTLRLDSYLNTSDSDNSDDSRLYRSDEKIMKANENFFRNAGPDGKVQALKGLIFDLQGVADKNLDQVQVPGNFYSFNQDRAQYETAYRKALKRELDSIGDDADRLKGRQQNN